MFGIGAGELVMILIAGLVIFGPGKLPEVGRAIGKGLREFRKAQAMFRATLDEVSLENEKKSVPLEKPPAETVSTDKTVSVDKTVTADKAVTAEKTVTTDKTVSVEKALPLENPTENISREKLIDATKEVFEEKKTAVSVDDVIQMAKDTSLAKPEDDNPTQNISAEKNSAADKITAAAESVATADKVTTAADDKVTAAENISVEKKNLVNVYDVIEMAKNNSFVKEKVYEKIFGGTGAVTYDADISKCINIARGGTDCA